MSSEPKTTKHWADTIAASLVEQYPDREVLTFASGISPSGRVHIGNLRDTATIWVVARAVRDLGRKVRLLHSWDDYDRFRKVPKGIPESYGEHIGRPLAHIPDPFGEFESYAARHEREFEKALAELGIETEFIYQAPMYEGGAYREGIIHAFRLRHEIYDLIPSRRKLEADAAEEREAYVPLTVYCDECDRDATRLTIEDEPGLRLSYTCAACGHSGRIDLNEARNVKLPWKVDWAMRWRYEKVAFEPGGKDHATAGGSFDVSSSIAKEVFDYEPPVFQPYEFIGIKGLTGKMAGSSGMLMTPADLLEIYQPEVLLWMYARVAPMKVFDVAVDDQVLRMYDEFDKALAGEPQVDTDVRALELSRIPGRELHPVPFRQLAGFSGIVQGDAEALESIFERMDLPYRSHQFEERLHKAERWLGEYMPDQRVTLRTEPDADSFKRLDAKERDWVRKLDEWLRDHDDFSIDDATEAVYAIPKEPDMDKKAQSSAQRRFFQIVYNLLFGKDRGPRLGTFLAVVSKERYLGLLEFTAPDS